MADEKLTDIVATFTAPLAHDDILYGVDVSDVTDDPAGSSKQAEAKYLPGPVFVERITNATAGEFDFSSIPTGGKVLKIQGWVRSNQASTLQGTQIFFNTNTTTSSYHYNHGYTTDGANNSGEGELAFAGGVPGANSPTGSYAWLDITIPNYDSATQLKVCHAAYATNMAASSSRHGSSLTTSTLTDAITRVRIQTDNHSTNELLGELTAYVEF